MSFKSDTRHWIIVAAAAAGIGIAAVGCEQGHEHAGHTGETAGLELNQGRKWATDEPLRTGMKAMQTLVAQAGQHPSPEQSARLAQGLRVQVDYLIANCKLEPKADAVLHVLIGRILAGAASLGDPATVEQGLATVREALRLYPQYFDHPDWR